ncbi:MAG: adenylate/guanylate cyclase domain-containing protein, partial [Rhodomicrobium sp.]|nr:adenylate/guanylate cyclase domain-containing protein [Rhodomicrobium sp.]
MQAAGGCTAFKRRLVTILSADVSGFCRLMGQDDELTLSRLLSYRRIMEDAVVRMNGRMFGVAGDSWMAEFESPVEAVRCAVECQDAIETKNEELPEGKRIRFRMGVHMGDVIVDGPGLFGDEVNIAARLQAVCQPGHLIVSETVFRHVFGKVNLQFKALGPQQLKNIAAPVSAFAAEASGISGANGAEDLLSAAGLSQPVPGFDGRPAIAVLPFHTWGSSNEDEHLGEGFAEDLINGLSNVRSFPVISSASSFIFRHHALDARSIGRALGARYLVTGSVRLAGQELRLTVNLIDAANGLNLWSHPYRIDFSKHIEVQDEITAGIVSVLDTEVERAEQSRSCSRKPEDLGTWELIRRGIWHLNKFKKEDSAAALACFEEALRRDPSSREARIQLAWWHFWDVWIKSGDRSAFQATERFAREALHIDPWDARAHLLVGIAVMMMGQPERARRYFLNAVQHNPSLAPAHASIGSSYILAGEPEKAISPLLLSIRLNPRAPFTFHCLGELAIAFYMQDDWTKAVEFAERSLQFRTGYWYARAILIASLARSARLAKAQA